MNGISMSISLRDGICRSLRNGMLMPRLRGRVNAATESTNTPSAASNGLPKPARRGCFALTDDGVAGRTDLGRGERCRVTARRTDALGPPHP